MSKKLALSVLLAIAASSTFAEPWNAIQANPDSSAYLQDSRGSIVRSGTGLCWRSGYWTPADAVAGCDGALLPPIAKPTAPPIAPPVALQPEAPPPAAPAPARTCDFSVTLSGDQAFGFNRTVLSAAAKHALDTDVISRLRSCETIDRLRVTGHADRLGSKAYNRKLSEKRADAVAAYLKSKGVSTRIEAIGAGESAPVASCGKNLSHSRLIACLSPDRRVAIEVQGKARQ